MAEFLFGPVPHDEAIDFIQSKPVLSRQIFDGLLPELKGRAFTITGVEAFDTVQRVRDLAAELPAGADWNDTKASIADEISPFFASDDRTAEQVAIAANARAELLIRTHGQQAYAAAQYRELDAQRKIFPYWQYVTLGDGHVRPAHAALDKIILPADHEFWRTHFPPWDWGCRCHAVAISRDDFDDAQKADAKRAPDERHALDSQDQEELTKSRRIVRNGVTYNVSAPIEKGKPGAFKWHPGDLRLSLDDLKKRYDPPVWDAFEKWARKTRIEEINKSVWGWLGGDTEWPALTDLTRVKSLGGSTGAELMREPATKRAFVLKKGKSAAHLENEFAADEAYRALGINVPKSKLYPATAGPAKLSQFIEGTTLNNYLAKATADEAALVLGKAQEHFVADALFANHDVVGLNLDNLLVDKSGQMWRIDNGGAFAFRAQGGVKTTWGAQIGDLATMRDAKINPAAAKVFGSISETEIKRQIAEILPKRDALLAAVPPEIRHVLAQRLDSLEKMLSPAGSLESFAEEIKASRIVGRAAKWDKGDIEDTQVLFWTERNAGGQIVTRAKLKMTEAGSAKIMDRLRASLPTSISAPPDPYWSTIEKALKTVNAHAQDGKYNAGTLAELAAKKTALQKVSTPQAKHYLGIIDEIEKAKTARIATTHFKAYEPPAKQSATGTKEFQVERKRLEYLAKTTAAGEATEAAHPIFSTEAYLIDLEGTKVRFVPWKEPDGTTEFKAPYAFRGYVEVLHPHEPSGATIADVMTRLATIGIDTAAVTDEYAELMYLRKGMQIRTDIFTPAKLRTADGIIAEPVFSEAEKIAKLKAIVERDMKLKLPAAPPAPGYDPRGHANSAGQGWVRTERWDLPRAEIEKEMPGWALHHSTSGDVAEVINSILHGGGDFTNTTERLRKGIAITQGMSPTADLDTGGANYLFSRIFEPAKAAKYSGFNFKIGLLARQDAFSFPGDRFGNVKDTAAYKLRAKTIADLKKFQASGSNETILKWGVPLLDEIDSIVVNSAAERKRVLDVFKKHGTHALPDGRTVEDIVKAKK